MPFAPTLLPCDEAFIPDVSALGMVRHALTIYLCYFAAWLPCDKSLPADASHQIEREFFQRVDLVVGDGEDIPR